MEELVPVISEMWIPAVEGTQAAHERGGPLDCVSYWCVGVQPVLVILHAKDIGAVGRTVFNIVVLQISSLCL